jgi:hypothetical protein
MNDQQPPNPPKPPPQMPSGPQVINIVKNLSANFEARAEFFNHQTVVIRTRYALLLDKGFTDVQALELCTRNWENCL